MFTGIVQGQAIVHRIEHRPNLHHLVLELPAPLTANIQLGASIATNGTCLTVTAVESNRVHFDVMMETLRVTNLGTIKEGELVNVERAARFGDEIGGHLLSGHIHTQVTITKIESPENNRIIWFEIAEPWRKYVLPKGFVALNGASLTIGEVTDSSFNVYLIPETLKITTFGSSRVGDKINLEIDSQTQSIVDTVERLHTSS
jgi:riboflavin synthase